jgi:hypothetical protein
MQEAMQFSPKRQEELFNYLRALYIELLIDEFMAKKFNEKRAREKYFKKVYERLKLDEKENEEVFMIGALTEYVFRSLPSDFHDPDKWKLP